MFLGPSCLMMCPVTIPGSEQDWQSKNAGGKKKVDSGT